MSDTPDPAPPADPADVTDWKAKYEALLPESRKWEQRAKDNSTAAARLVEVETELAAATTWRTDREAADVKAAADATIAADREAVAAEYGVPANVLRGSTKDEFTAHAAELKPLVTNGPVIPNQGDEPTAKKSTSPWSEVLSGLDQQRDTATT